MHRLALSVIALLVAGASVGTALPDDRINVLLITVDTFRPDRLSGYGHDRPTSPYLDSLAADGALFEQTVSSSSWTTPGLISVLTGQWAPTHGVDVRGKTLRPGTATMATELAKVGYVTPDILYLSSIPNLQNLGLTMTYPDRNKHLPNGDDVLFRAIEAYRDSAFFLYYHYRNLHLPYNPAEPYDALYTPPGYDRDGFVRERAAIVRENVTVPIGSLTFEPEDSAWVRGLYDGQIRQMDETFFRPLVQHLKDLGLYERTMVIVTADHGEELLEHGFIGHPSTSFVGSAYDEQILIPLTMTCPALIPPNTRVSTQVQNVDILPTVLDLLDLPIPESVQGRSLVPALEGKPIAQVPAFTETTQGGYQSTPAMMRVRVRAHRDPPWKLIHTHGPGQDRYELYNLDEDPREMNDVAARHPDVFERMRKELHAWLLTATREPVPDATLDAKGIHAGDLRVTYPANGDTIRYVDAEKTVDVRWTGAMDAAYAIEYRVGEGNYFLEGRIPVVGPVSTHGPFTEEMWNMLTLYNPFSFRVVATKSDEESGWVQFTIAPTSEDVRPGVWMRTAATASFVLAEASFLWAGLWAGAALTIERIAGYRLSDVMGWGLVLVLGTAVAVPPVVRRVGRERSAAWGIVFGYTGVIYATLSVAPELWGIAYRLTHGRVGYAAAIVGGVFGLWVVHRLVTGGIGLARSVAVLCLGGVYVYLLMWLSQSPAERFHLAEYGLLSYLTYRACRVDFTHGRAVVGGLAAAALLGTGDEFIQWALPNRVFEWKDVWLNIGSAGLGMALVVLLRRRA